MSFGAGDPRELVPTVRRQGDSAVNTNETTKVLDQADALMRRHRVFVAGMQTTEAPSAPRSADDDDLPILTDAVDLPVAMDDQHRTASESAIPLRHRAMATLVNQWLEEILPNAVQEVSGELADLLVAKLSAKARLELAERLIKELDKPSP